MPMVTNEPHSAKAAFVPIGWDMAYLGELFEFRNGLNKAKQFFGSGTPIVNYMDVFERSGLKSADISGRVTLSPDEISSFEVRRGDVFFTRTSETVEEVGVAAVMLDDPCNTVFSGFVLRARPRDDRLDDEYKQYCFASKSVRLQVVSKATHTTRALTNGKALTSVEISIPPLPEQRAIAAALSDIDGLIDALNTLIAKKQAVKQATMQQLLTGRTRLPEFSGEWESKRLGGLFTFLTTANNPHSDLGDSGDVHYIHYGGVHALSYPVLDCAQQNLPRIDRALVERVAPVQDSDLVIVDASEDLAGVGKSIEIKGVQDKTIVAGLHTILCRGQSQFWAKGFKAYLQFMPAFKIALARVATGISVYAISKSQLAEITLPLPKKREQAAIAAVLSDMDSELEALERRRDKTEAIKQGMMQELLTGRIRLVEAK